MTNFKTTVPRFKYDDDAILFLERVLHNYLGKKLALEVLQAQNESHNYYLDRDNKLIYSYNFIVSPMNITLLFDGRKAFVDKKDKGFYLSSNVLFDLKLELGYRGLFHADKTFMPEIKDFLDENIEKSKSLKKKGDYLYIDRLYTVKPFEER